MSHAFHARGTPQPKYDPKIPIAEFLDNYEFWARSLDMDEDQQASSVVFSFDARIQKSIRNAYHSARSWDGMKTAICQIIRNLYDLNTFTKVEARFNSANNTKKYGESLSIFKERFMQYLEEYEEARARHGMSRWGERDRLAALQKKVSRDLRQLLIKKKHRVTTLQQAFTLCQQFLDNRTEMQQIEESLGEKKEDPHAMGLELWDQDLNQVRTFPAAVAMGAETPPPARANALMSSAPLAPARSSRFDEPGEQVETNVKATTRIWGEQKDFLKKTLDHHLEQINKSFEERMKTLQVGEEKRPRAAVTKAPERGSSQGRDRQRRRESPQREASPPKDKERRGRRRSRSSSRRRARSSPRRRSRSAPRSRSRSRKRSRSPRRYKQKKGRYNRGTPKRGRKRGFQSSALCWGWSEGYCGYGDRCSFAHPEGRRGNRNPGRDDSREDSNKGGNDVEGAIKRNNEGLLATFKVMLDSASVDQRKERLEEMRGLMHQLDKERQQQPVPQPRMHPDRQQKMAESGNGGAAR